MKQIASVLMSLLCIWIYLGTCHFGGNVFVDTDSVVCEEGICKASALQMWQEDAKNPFSLEANCQEGKIRLFGPYLPRGSTWTSEFLPDSAAGLVYKYLCDFYLPLVIEK